MISSLFLDTSDVKTQPFAAELSPFQAPATPFQHLLERMMSEPLQEQRERQAASTDATLLTVNPHMNIRAVMAAHPEQEVFYADGAIRVQAAAARSVLPPVSQAPSLRLSDPSLVPVAITDTQAFQQVIAPTALAALAMGTGLRARAEVSHPEHLSYLFKRTASTPVGKANLAYPVENQHAFWDQ